MFSLLPSLLTFESFAPFLLRLTLGAILTLWAYKAYKRDGKIKAMFVLEGLVGILLILGLFTQLAALISTVIFGKKLFDKIKAKAFMTDGVNYYFLLFIISISLIFTGAGFIAFDLPL